METCSSGNSSVEMPTLPLGPGALGFDCPVGPLRLLSLVSAPSSLAESDRFLLCCSSATSVQLLTETSVSSFFLCFFLVDTRL